MTDIQSEYFTPSQRSLILRSLEDCYWEFSEFDRKDYREICNRLGQSPYFNHGEGSSTLKKE